MSGNLCKYGVKLLKKSDSKNCAMIECCVRFKKINGGSGRFKKVMHTMNQKIKKVMRMGQDGSIKCNGVCLQARLAIGWHA